MYDGRPSASTTMMTSEECRTSARNRSDVRRSASTAASASVVSREFETMPCTAGTSNMFVRTCSNHRQVPFACRCRHRTRAHMPGVARTCISAARSSPMSSGWTSSAPPPSRHTDSGCPRIRSCDGERYAILPSRSMIARRSKPLCTSQRNRSSLSRSAISAALRSVMSRKWPTRPRHTRVRRTG